MIAKPYVDILLESNGQLLVDIKLLESLGYKPLNEILPNNNILNYGIMFREVSKKGSFRGYFIHIVPIVDPLPLRSFKQLLDSDEKVRKEYKQLKITLSQSTNNFIPYTLGKTDFVWDHILCHNDFSISIKFLADLIWNEDHDTLKMLFENNPMLAKNLYVLDGYITLLGVLFARKTPTSLKTAKLLLKYGTIVLGRGCYFEQTGDFFLIRKAFLEGGKELSVIHNYHGDHFQVEDEPSYCYSFVSE
eukprot:TRINITY_DN28098_c0_g1_i1.p1 TRINITY_DN28098_c0_g1~~TRINITY_DN28098_c0_g1_i1.p1  ORF type:complete len:261 (-),score=50.05 TRINITY_DN28098_c0_g1_i1:60-800(-)